MRQHLLAVAEYLESRRLLASYFVSPSGSDTNPGTSSAPFQTLQKAANTVVAGDTVTARAGTYSSGFVLGWDAPTAGTAAAPITFQADPAAPVGSVIIAGRGTNKTADGIDLEDGCHWITIKGFSITNTAGTITRDGIRVTGSNNVSVINNLIDHCGTFGIFSSFTTNFLVQGNTVTRTIGGSSTTGHGIYISNSPVNPVVRGNTIANNPNQGLQFNGDASQGGTGVATGALVENNIIHDSGSNGMNCDGLQNSRIQNNLFYANASNGICLFKIDASAGSQNNIIVNNTIYMPSSAGAALRIKDGATGNTVYNNVLLGGASGTLRISANSLSGLSSDDNAVADLYVSEDTSAGQTLSQWRTQTSQDAHSFVATAAQLFVNAGASDFHLKSGSVALNAGQGTLNAKAAPAQDIEGNSRPQGANWDIGTYEASSAPDTTPPVLSAFATSGMTANQVTITWTTNESADSQVEYGINASSENVTSLDASFVTSHSMILSGLTASTLYHYRVRSKDASGNLAVSGDLTFTTTSPDTTPPVVSLIAASNVTSGSATITWTTNEASNSQVLYGFSANYGNQSALDAALVTSHSVNLSGLVSGTAYHVSVLSRDGSGNLAAGSDFTFTTSTIAIASGALAYWPLSESSGTSTADSTGNNHTGSLLNGAAFTTLGQAGNAVTFDGVNDQIRISRTVSLETSKVSLSAWVKLTSGVQADWASIIKKTYGNDAAAPWGSYSLAISPSGHANVLAFFTGIAGTNGDTLEAPTALATGQWIYVSATYDPQVGEKKLYVNGSLVASKSISNPLVYDATSSGDIYIGQDPGGGEAFSGTIDSVGIWGRALTAAEIAAMASTTVSQAVNGTSGDDTIAVTRTDAQHVQVRVNQQSAVSIDLATVNAIQVNGSTGNDTITFTGLPGNDDVLVDLATIRFGSTRITETEVESAEYSGAGGSDVLSINGTRVKLRSDQTLSGLSIDASGTLDLTDRTVLLNYNAGSGSPLTALTALIRSGWNGGTWSGVGIATGSGNANQFGIGIVDDAANHQIKMKFTRYGDANADGSVSSLDFTQLALGFGGSSGTWFGGDFNYDNKVNALDFNELASNYGGTSTPALPMAFVNTEVAGVSGLFATAQLSSWEPTALIDRLELI